MGSLYTYRLSLRVWDCDFGMLFLWRLFLASSSLLFLRSCTLNAPLVIVLVSSSTLAAAKSAEQACAMLCVPSLLPVLLDLVILPRCLLLGHSFFCLFEIHKKHSELGSYLARTLGHQACILFLRPLVLVLHLDWHASRTPMFIDPTTAVPFDSGYLESPSGLPPPLSAEKQRISCCTICACISKLVEPDPEKYNSPPSLLQGLNRVCTSCDVAS
ncbi:hypothetical protein E4T43_06494 [Aureobasidium subglaciale]|nr:hypothetical protein E4T43_06494 [Aureobasidium subglaciale]